MERFPNPVEPEDTHDSRAQAAPDPAALKMRWTELHERSAAIAAKAALASEPFGGRIAAFGDAICTLSDERLVMVQRGIEDLDAITQPGLTALAAIEARGLDTTASALALWREFHAAREAIMALNDAETEPA